MNPIINKSHIRKTIIKIICYFVLAVFLLLAIFYLGTYLQSKNDRYAEGGMQNNGAQQSSTIAPSAVQTLPIVPSATPEKISNFQLPVLMYHYIRDWNKADDKIGTNLSVSPKNFESQMQWLANNNYQSVDFNYFSYPYKMDKKPILITFDDGYKDAYTNAYPILKKYKLTGVFYIITNKVGTSEYLNWDMIREMQVNGMQFGSHTVKHSDLRNLSDIALVDELKTSKEKIEQELKTVIDDFCYPSGKYDDKTIAKLKEIGYKTATTVENGTANEKTDLFRIPRKRIQNSTDFASLLP
jgi:peptidoglycan/xylan/chitin deacetylase (PgdA/CDA1 family)